MLRRFILAGLAAALAAPVFAIAPASAAVLFSCSAIDSGPGPFSYAGFAPGLSHNQTAQEAEVVVRINDTPCSNGEQADIYVGDDWGIGLTATTTFGPRPLGCPVAWGGAGPDYPDQKPILLGATSPSLYIWWYSDSTSSEGIAKVKQGPAGDQWRLIFNITSGKYAPPAGKKTKLHGTVAISNLGSGTDTCADDSDPVDQVPLSSVGDLIVTQK